MSRITLYQIDSEIDSEPLMALVRKLKNESPVYRSYDRELELAEQRVKTITAHPHFYGVIAYEIFPDFTKIPIGHMFGHFDLYWYSGEAVFTEDSLYVVPEKRGTRLAVRMIRKVEDHLRQVKALRIRAGASTGINNDRTLRLYQALGYELQEDGTVQKEITSNGN